jgi:hypothetical protein
MGALREAVTTLTEFETVAANINSVGLGRVKLTLEEKQQKLQESRFIWLRLFCLVNTRNLPMIKKCRDSLAGIICYESITKADYNRLEKVSLLFNMQHLEMLDFEALQAETKNIIRNIPADKSSLLKLTNWTSNLNPKATLIPNLLIFYAAEDLHW